MKKLVLLLLPILLLSSCLNPSRKGPQRQKSSHIEGYIGIVNTTVNPGNGYMNIAQQFDKDGTEYVTRCIFSEWDDNGPSGEAQYYKYYHVYDTWDWMDRADVDDDGLIYYRPWVLGVTNDGNEFAIYSAYEPWKLDYHWTIVEANNRCLKLNDVDKMLFLQIDFLETIDAYLPEGQYPKE